MVCKFDAKKRFFPEIAKFFQEKPPFLCLCVVFPCKIEGESGLFALLQEGEEDGQHNAEERHYVIPLQLLAAKHKRGYHRKDN